MRKKEEGARKGYIGTYRFTLVPVVSTSSSSSSSLLSLASPPILELSGRIGLLVLGPAMPDADTSGPVFFNLKSAGFIFLITSEVLKRASVLFGRV